MILHGYFCKVTKHGKLKFRYLPEDSRRVLLEESEKLLGAEHSEYIKRVVTGCEETAASCDDITLHPHLPFDDMGFTVVLPKWVKSPPQDITGRVGLPCAVKVSMAKYDFTSKAAHNVGEHVTGVSLTFAGMGPRK